MKMAIRRKTMAKDRSQKLTVTSFGCTRATFHRVGNKVYRFEHGSFKRKPPPDVRPPLEEATMRIMGVYGSTVPDSTTGMLLISSGFGHFTRSVDYVKMRVWYTEHHPEAFKTAADGTRELPLLELSPESLESYFTHASAEERAGIVTHEIGSLWDDTHPYLAYSNIRNERPVKSIVASIAMMNRHSSKSKPKSGETVRKKPAFVSPLAKPRKVKATG
jgi:hypothetical protein